jgi:hypothetical protein
MNEKWSERVENFNATVHDSEILLSVARDSDLQRSAVAQLSDLSIKLKNCKQEAIADENEDRANVILGMECVAEAIKAELSMWLLLKEEMPEKAWDNLIAAQTATSGAIRAHRQFAHLENHAERLDAIEKLVFPPQIFLSVGMIVRKEICTICNSDYDACAHVVGMPYWGVFCSRRLENIELDHVSIVENPANKLCRVTRFSVEGGTRNRMTWRIESNKRQEHQIEDKKELFRAE